MKWLVKDCSSLDVLGKHRPSMDVARGGMVGMHAAKCVTLFGWGVYYRRRAMDLDEVVTAGVWRRRRGGGVGQQMRTLRRRVKGCCRRCPSPLRPCLDLAVLLAPPD